jgi:dienelactone hydrolase
MEPTMLNLLGAYGPWAEETAKRPGRLSFAPVMKSGKIRLAEWKKQGRAMVRELLGPLPAGSSPPGRQAPQVQSVGKRLFDGLEVEELTWQLPYGPPTEAVFLKPAGAQGPLPGVLALHDHGGIKHFGRRKIVRTSDEDHPALRAHQNAYYGGTAWANELARRGYGVLAHDVFPFGSRRILAAQVPAHVTKRLLAAPEVRPELTPADLDPNRALAEVDVPPGEPAERLARYEAFAAGHEDVVARSLFALGYTFPGLVLAEDLAALGVLAARADVDPDRLGCCGLSGGGLRACFLAGLDDSIDCAVTVGFFSTWRDFALHSGFTHTWMAFVPHLARQLDFPEVFGLRVPLPSLVLTCGDDPLFRPEETRRAGELLGEIYRQAGAAEKARVSEHPGPHRFDRTMQAEAFVWLDRWLGA